MERSQHIKAIRESIDNAKSTGLKLNAVIIANSCCDECSKIDGKIIPFEEVDRIPPIPHDKCTRPSGCNCTISFAAIRNKNGRLIK